MVELNPSRWLLVAGILGILTPWVIHWSTSQFGYIQPYQLYVVLFGAGLASSVTAAAGAPIVLSRGVENGKDRLCLATAIILGVAGLNSSVFVFALSMM